MSHLEDTAADKSSFGFEYQDLVLVDKLINLKAGEAIGLEIFDDLHVENISNDLTMIQVKHSLLGGNITERDSDLWKTLYNWYQSLLSLPTDKNITFQLYTNKSLNNQNFVELLKKAKENKPELIASIKTIYQALLDSEAKKDKNSTANPIFKFAGALAKASEDDLNFIFERFEFHTDTKFIIDRINSQLEYLAVPLSKVDEIRKFVIGAYKDYKIREIYDSNKILIKYETFRIQMGFDRILRSTRSDEIDFERFYDRYYAFDRTDETSFLDSIFSHQLAALGIPAAEIIDHGIEMLITEKLISELKNEGNFANIDDERLENQGHHVWNTIHKKSHETAASNETDHIEAAKYCYRETLKKELKSKSLTLPEGMSRGKFIKLSNIPRIGWRKDWMEKYSK